MDRSDILKQFPQMGTVPYGDEWKKQAKFLKNGGGREDPDTMRGFAATTQYWSIQTSAGWTLVYDDNGAGFVSATEPDGTKWHNPRNGKKRMERGELKRVDERWLQRK